MQSSVLEIESRLSIEHSAREHFDIRIPDKLSFFATSFTYEQSIKYTFKYLTRQTFIHRIPKFISQNFRNYFRRIERSTRQIRLLIN